MATPQTVVMEWEQQWQNTGNKSLASVSFVSILEKIFQLGIVVRFEIKKALSSALSICVTNTLRVQIKRLIARMVTKADLI